MEFITAQSSLVHVEADALAIGVLQGGQLPTHVASLDQATGGRIDAMISRREFDAKSGSTIVIRDVQGACAKRIILIGMGEPTKVNVDAYLQAVQIAVKSVMALPVETLALAFDHLDIPGLSDESKTRLGVVSASDALYRFDQYRTKGSEPTKLKRICILSNDLTTARQGLEMGVGTAAGVRFARDLGNTPPNVCTPTWLADQAKVMAKDHGLKCNVLNSDEIKALGMASFLAVARGSDEAPRFIVLEHRAKGKKSKSTARKPTVLVGKGITFDSGGISIKPSADMDEMKYDMCGAAAVIGTMQAVAMLKLPLDVIALIPTCENMPSGRASRPGDIVKTMSGKTVEILNTDAEGRLILCDALTYAERYEPEAVIDVATLTGACVIALGHVNTGLFSPDDSLAQDLLKAAQNARDPAWRMPLESAYQESLKSPFADIANIGGRAAGAVTAACFLSRFTEKYAWAHLDIAGTAWKSGKDKTATGRPVALLVEFLRQRAQP